MGRALRGLSHLSQEICGGGSSVNIYNSKFFIYIRARAPPKGVSVVRKTTAPRRGRRSEEVNENTPVSLGGKWAESVEKSLQKIADEMPLVESLVDDLARIANALEKIALALPPGESEKDVSR